MPRVILDKRIRPPEAVLSLSAAALATVETQAVRQWTAGIAYDIWERRGRHRGDDLWNWLTAEKFVAAQLTALSHRGETAGHDRDVGGEA